MNKILVSALLTLIRRLLDPAVVSRILSIVASLDNQQLSGSDKRALAGQQIASLASDAAPWLLNLAIEIAVARLRLTAKD